MKHQRRRRNKIGLVAEHRNRFAELVCRSALRTHKTIRGTHGRNSEEVSIDGEEGGLRVASIPAAIPSALEITEREGTGAYVQRCFDFLSDSYRAVILLYEAHSLTVRKIAELLGESVGTIKIRLHRARRKLQEIMQIGCAVSQSATGVPCCEPKAFEEISSEEVRSLLKK